MQALFTAQKLLQKLSLFKTFILILTLFVSNGVTHTALAQSQSDNSITLTQQPTSSASQSVTYAGKGLDFPYKGYTSLGNAGAKQPVPAPQLGTYDLEGTSQLVLTGGDIVVDPGRRRVEVENARVLYRVYLAGTPTTTTSPAYSSLSLPLSGTFGSFNDDIYKVANANLDLLAGLTSGGAYTVEVIFQLSLSDGTTSNDPSSSYTLNFNVTPRQFTPAGGSTSWISTNSTDWNVASNWSNGVPTGASNAVILAPTATIRYAYPVLDSPLNGPISTYEVNNLTLEGNSSTIKAELFLHLATLVVNGNLRQPAGGLRATTVGNVGVTDPKLNSTLILGGVNQILSGQLIVPDVVVAGSGIKSVVNELRISNTLSFRPASVTDGVLLQSATEDNVNNQIVTAFNTTGNTFINLANIGLINQAPGYTETSASYVNGVLRATRRMSTGVLQDFGNIGLEMTPNHTPSAQILVTRVVGEPQLSPIGNGVGIKRVFTITGDEDSELSNFKGSGSYVRFRYLDSPNELNTIAEPNLLMFRSFNISGPYGPVFGDLNESLNFYDRSFLTSFPAYNLTLGDRTRPLPVTLTKFDAKRMGTDVLVTWQTASETNNKGFEVQVSTNGTDFRTLATVASTSANSSSAKSYSYLDTERGKAGKRYYRLRQIDLDGKDAYFAPVTVSFEGKASNTGLAAYPNPFTGSEPLHLAFTSSTGGKGQLRISDMTGRTIRQETVELAAGLSEFSVNGLTDLKAGIYIVNFMLPTGEVKNLKVVKQ